MYVDWSESCTIARGKKLHFLRPIFPLTFELREIVTKLVQSCSSIGRGRSSESVALLSLTFPHGGPALLSQEEVILDSCVCGRIKARELLFPNRLLQAPNFLSIQSLSQSTLKAQLFKNVRSQVSVLLIPLRRSNASWSCRSQWFASGLNVKSIHNYGYGRWRSGKRIGLCFARVRW